MSYSTVAQDATNLPREYGLLKMCSADGKQKSTKGAKHTKTKKDQFHPLQQQRLQMGVAESKLEKSWLDFGKYFLVLPLEVRRFIYKHLFDSKYYIPVPLCSNGKPLVLEKTDRKLKKVLMLLDHKQIRLEATEFYISINSFMVDSGVLVQFVSNDWHQWITSLCIVVPVWDKFKCFGSKDCTCGGSRELFIDFEQEKLRLLNDLPRLKNLQVTLCADVYARDFQLDAATKCLAFALTMLSLYEKGVLKVFTLRLWDSSYEDSDLDSETDEWEMPTCDDDDFDTVSIAHAPFISTGPRAAKLDTMLGYTVLSPNEIPVQTSAGFYFTEVDVTYWLDIPDLKIPDGFPVHSKKEKTEHPTEWAFNDFYGMMQSELRFKRNWTKEWMQQILNDDKLSKFYGQAADGTAACTDSP